MPNSTFSKLTEFHNKMVRTYKQSAEIGNMSVSLAGTVHCMIDNFSRFKGDVSFLDRFLEPAKNHISEFQIDENGNYYITNPWETEKYWCALVSETLSRAQGREVEAKQFQRTISPIRMFNSIHSRDIKLAIVVSVATVFATYIGQLLYDVTKSYFVH